MGTRQVTVTGMGMGMGTGTGMGMLVRWARAWAPARGSAADRQN